MATVVYKGLGFNIWLIDPPMISVWGGREINVKLQSLGDKVFTILVTRACNFTGDQIRFIRQHLPMSAAAFAAMMGVSESVVSQWESRHTRNACLSGEEDVRLRRRMASKARRTPALLRFLAARQGAGTFEEDHSRIVIDAAEVSHAPSQQIAAN